MRSATLTASFLAGAATGAAAGAYLMRWYMSEQHFKHDSGDGSAAPVAVVPRLDAATLNALSAASHTLPPGGASVPESVPDSVAYSLPPTPRLDVNGRASGRYDNGGDSRLRMAFVVRRDLAWGRGKLAVMVAHAALALFKKAAKARYPPLPAWEAAKGPKLLLRADDEAGLLAVADAARDAGVLLHSIAEPTGDATRPRTRTILALGPLPADVLQKLAVGLTLL